MKRFMEEIEEFNAEYAERFPKIAAYLTTTISKELIILLRTSPPESAALDAAEVARDSIHDCSCKNGVTHEYVDGMPVAEIPCPFCWELRAALDAAKEGK